MHAKFFPLSHNYYIKVCVLLIDSIVYQFQLIIDCEAATVGAKALYIQMSCSFACVHLIASDFIIFYINVRWFSFCAIVKYFIPKEFSIVRRIFSEWLVLKSVCVRLLSLPGRHCGSSFSKSLLTQIWVFCVGWEQKRTNYLRVRFRKRLDFNLVIFIFSLCANKILFTVFWNISVFCALCWQTGLFEVVWRGHSRKKDILY